VSFRFLWLAKRLGGASWNFLAGFRLQFNVHHKSSNGKSRAGRAGAANIPYVIDNSGHQALFRSAA
jgi:hypothetical protein